MTTKFTRARGGGVWASFDAGEAAVLAQLVAELLELLGTSVDDVTGRFSDQLPGLGSPDWGAGPGSGTSGGQGGATDRPAGGEGTVGEDGLAWDPFSDEPDTVDSWTRALGISDQTSPPEDPALARLFPDAYRDDPKAAGEFRRYTEVGLRARKIADARQVLGTLAGVGRRQRLDVPTATAWLRTLTDLRLTMGTRLEVTEEMDEQAWASWDDDDPRKPVFAVYSWLGWLQEMLVRALW